MRQCLSWQYGPGFFALKRMTENFLSIRTDEKAPGTNRSPGGSHIAKAEHNKQRHEVTWRKEETIGWTSGRKGWTFCSDRPSVCADNYGVITGRGYQVSRLSATLYEFLVPTSACRLACGSHINHTKRSYCSDREGKTKRQMLSLEKRRKRIHQGQQEREKKSKQDIVNPP